MSSSFKSRLHNREPLLGTWLKTPSSMVCEVLAETGLDLICIDAEHSPFDRLEQDRCIHALRSGNMPALVRIPAARPEWILNALDCGASGIVVPHVTSATMAEEMVTASHFGAGGRGYAGSTRAAGYTTKAMSAHLSDSAAEICVIAQIEDLEALAGIEEIAAVPGIDCLFIGRIDLTVALAAESPKSPVVIDAVEKICQAGSDAGVPVGMFLGDMSELAHWKAAGANLFLLSSDHSFLLTGAARLVEAFAEQ
ncbi:MAG: aldolase/citrate lyase family protein [Pseudomonadota bacterium]